MASNALEEKIEKIRLQNEKIRQRYEEVEADKKNAAKLNALVQLVPSDDWPERKEPPEFSAPPKNPQKPKPSKEPNDRPAAQHYPGGIQERLSKKDHKFAQGDGPPPDPKYNFLADSERESRAAEEGKTEDEKNRSRNKTPRGPPRKRGGAVGGGISGGANQPFFKDNRGPHAFHSKNESLPEYEAWRAERDRIDEARISRQKTAEGNWRREWDCNKVNVEKEPPAELLRKGDSNRKDYDRRTTPYENDHSNRGHGTSRTYHGVQKPHVNQDYRRSHQESNQTHEFKRQVDNKQPFSSPDDRSVTVTDKTIKVLVNPLNQRKGTVMSVKVSSPSIAGTGRVGPRQKSRVTYSSQSDAEAINHELDQSPRPKSFDEKGANFNSSGQPRSTPKSPFAQRKKEGNSKSPYPQRKDYRGDEPAARPKNPTKAANTARNEPRDQRQPNNPRPQRAQKRGANKSTAESTHIVPSSHDNAIPSEYDPTHSFDNEKFSEQGDNNNAEQVFNKSNQSNVESAEKSEKSGDSAQIVESVDQNLCNINVESNDNKIVENNENGKVNENISNAEIDGIAQSIEEEIVCEKEEATVTNQGEVMSQNKIDENVDEKPIEIISSDQTVEDDKEQKNEEVLQESKKSDGELIQEKNESVCCADGKETELIVPSEELHPSISQEIEDSEEKQISSEIASDDALENKAEPLNVAISQEIEETEEKQKLIDEAREIKEKGERQVLLDDAIDDALENEARILNLEESEGKEQINNVDEEKINDESHLEKEEKQISLDEAMEVKENAVNLDESSKTTEIIDVCEEKATEESPKVVDEPKNSSEAEKADLPTENKSGESKEVEPTCSPVSENTSFNDSGIVVVEPTPEKTKVIELDTSNNSSADESGLVCDSSKSDITLNEVNSKSDIQNDSQVQSDPVEICDNSSAASEATVASAVDNKQVKISGDDVSEPTKDDDVVIKADGENSAELAVQKEENFAEKESPIIAAVKPKKTDD